VTLLAWATLLNAAATFVLSVVVARHIRRGGR